MIAILLTAVLLPGALVASLAVGANPLSPDTVLATITGGGTAESHYVIFEQRLPRTAAAVAVGAGLGAAGALIQAFTRNPLADPGILGVNAGAAFFVAVGVGLWGMTDPVAHGWLACAGALLAALAVQTIGTSRRGPAEPTHLTMVGVAVGAVLSGLTTALVLTHPQAFDHMRSWNAGSLLDRGFEVSLPLMPLIGLGLLGAVLMTRALNSMSLGADVARAQGVAPHRLQHLVLGCLTLLAGGATAIAGPIAFVGLMVPHVARWTWGTDQRTIMTGSILLGALLMLLADVLGRLLVPGEMPVGLVTAFVGAPVLIVLVRRRRASTL
ncbi:iron chelate uptake ABC transporter family permease subunit [Nesterenkonia xinjiangensis]|uniref:Iron complex transport system permease protein n=1 Tax=Nesterenkonia xinjiangensis TaxID=225327 RepID=A0A7Z0GJV3_9MICC|nr:iron chelate uptake ABC transporter family permease subunit [Nesterenkonia xinjiangensis]NYJ77305.1 iron complex transport system permease protein [Nesterenkonia xinjiangensis]